MRTHCPNCGSFTKVYWFDKTVAHRLDGTLCQSRFTYEACSKCDYATKPTTATIDYWKDQASQGLAILEASCAP